MMGPTRQHLFSLPPSPQPFRPLLAGRALVPRRYVESRSHSSGVAFGWQGLRLRRRSRQATWCGTLQTLSQAGSVKGAETIAIGKLSQNYRFMWQCLQSTRKYITRKIVSIYPKNIDLICLFLQNYRFCMLILYFFLIHRN